MAIFQEISRVLKRPYLKSNVRRAWAATGIVVCNVGLLPEARVGGHGYKYVGLFITGISTHLDAIALRLQHGQPSHNNILV